jgi:hypothetical protein
MSTPTDSTFKVRNTLVVNTAMWANSTGIYFGASPTLALNATNFAGTSNNSNNLGGATWNSYVNTSGNFTLGGTMTFSANTTYSGIATFNANSVLGASLIANGLPGTANMALITNGTTPFWGTVQAGWVSGLAPSATTDTTNATNITTGAMNIARVSGAAPSATTDTTNATNITTGTLPNARLANVVLCNVSGQQINGGGARVTAYTITTGSTTLDSGNGPLQYYLNSQTATITAPSNDGSFVMFINNAASANSLTWSGFTFSGTNYGDPLGVTANNKYLLYINRTVGISTFICKALQ